jgi:hypothetical protein
VRSITKFGVVRDPAEPGGRVIDGKPADFRMPVQMACFDSG